MVFLALLIDYGLGEPKRYHPLVAFGFAADNLETVSRRLSQSIPFKDKYRLRFLGALSWGILVLLPSLLLWHLIGEVSSALHWIAQVLILYFVIGWRSLREHAISVVRPLLRKDLLTARHYVSRMVSRDTDSLTEQGVAAATIESVLENGSDGVFAPIFWFVVLGAPGALAYRLANTLDAMWGYRNDQYRHFGWAAARLDDVFNWIPARLTALSYSALGNQRQGLRCLLEQGGLTDSPNAGRVMCAGAGSLNIELGGDSYHKGQRHFRPIMGSGNKASVNDIFRAIKLLNSSVMLWMGVLCVFTLISRVTL